MVGGAAALFTFIRSTAEYVRQGTQKRIELYLDIRKKFDANSKFTEIRNLLDKEDRAITKISLKERQDYAAYFEEVAILMNSGVLKPDVAFYMFSYEAIQCWESELFWHGISRDQDYYWGLLRMFVTEMKQKRKIFVLTPRRFVF